METITKQQQTLLKEIKPSGEINEAAGNCVGCLNKIPRKFRNQTIYCHCQQRPNFAKLNSDPIRWRPWEN